MRQPDSQMQLAIDWLPMVLLLGVFVFFLYRTKAKGEQPKLTWKSVLLWIVVAVVLVFLFNLFRPHTVR